MLDSWDPTIQGKAKESPFIYRVTAEKGLIGLSPFIQNSSQDVSDFSPVIQTLTGIGCSLKNGSTR